jgi:hypothetical protein
VQDGLGEADVLRACFSAWLTVVTTAAMAPSRGSDRLYRVTERQACLVETTIEGEQRGAVGHGDGEMQGVSGAQRQVLAVGKAGALSKLVYGRRP